ncbi:cell surface protein SprA [Hymenobacter sp. J193]|uniref:T9SS outer membrane translocon Sov/SprA n=1 Tax=Hymenobacter sp. J193 TaxID=2898429 RepID=UPI002151B76B|nr:cell surface protein SprA [Hymenobacter sp. J193]MCR5888495.1 cell surface protein SprA [Hymenobacter sp. J193]
MNTGKKTFTTVSLVVASLLAWWSQSGATGSRAFGLQWASWRSTAGSLAWLPDTPRTAPTDTTRYRPSRRPKVAPEDRAGNRLSPQRRESPLLLDLPPNVNLNVTVDDSLQGVDVSERVGSDIDFRDPTRMSFEEYSRWQQDQTIRNYFRNRAAGGVAGEAGSPAVAQRLIPKIYLGPAANRIFGGNYVDIRPNGSVTVRAGAKFNRNRNPTLTLRQQKTGDFNFEQNMNLNLTGQIGEKMRVTLNYDTKAAFDFENNMKLDFTGFDTDIIRKVELGNVSLPLNNSLIQGGQNLFGAKTQLQFGKLSVTAVASTLRGQADEVRISNGGQSRPFEIKASQYEKDRHFFLSQFFRDRYDASLRNLPTVQSGIQIRYLEVYVTNDNRTTENLRNVVALMDLAEPRVVFRRDQFPPTGTTRTPADNAANQEYELVKGSRENLGVDAALAGRGLVKNVDFEHVRARKLDPREYTFNEQLGYLSLNTQLLPEQVLGVSYEYTYNGKSYRVGETAGSYSAGVQEDQVIFLKMLKSTNPALQYPTWDLMMKNIYSLNATQLNRDQFRLDIIYKDDATGVDLLSLKEGQQTANVPLVQVFNLDNANANNDRPSDGNFDFLPGITIDPEQGRIIFPQVEPFGRYLKSKFDTVAERDLVDKYVYQELYDQVQSDAQQRQEKDKFFLTGRYQATSSDEINLPGIRVAEGSVRVYAGSTLLTEGTDYQVFYDQAKVKVLNPAYLNAANELRVTFEKDALVQVQPRSLLGARFDYRLNDDINFGATVLHLLENQAPGINRVNIGDEPGNNTIYGLDVNLRRESRALTRYLDMLPLISTKAPSTVAFSGEFAKLVPGKTQLGRGENGVSYIDDFEAARTPYTLTGGVSSLTAWRMAATPLPILGNSSTIDLAANYRRAKLAWYSVDQSYYNNGSSRPNNITADDLLNHYTRGVQRKEIFPNRDVGTVGNGYEYPLDLAYFPTERGPYNYNPQTGPDGRTLPAGTAPGNFAGISREITFDTDFDNANIEYLEFWLMDPFLKGKNGQVNDSQNQPTENTTGGELYLNLGTISEDALKDGRYAFENGLSDDPSDPNKDTDRTKYGRVSRQQFLTDAFSTANGGRDRQDVGLDGLNDDEEKAEPEFGTLASADDPSADNFRHHLSDYYNSDGRDVKILGRYKEYNGLQGNSAENSQQSSTPLPDKEDLNRDNIIQDTERYYEYKIPLRPGGLEVGQNFIVDKVSNRINNDVVTWYQFRIPVRQPTAVRGTTDGLPFGFKSIRFMRLYLTQWQQPTVLRFVQMQFVANQWRRYLGTVAEPGRPNVNTDTDADLFTISTVSVEENGISGTGGSDAIPYVVPPGIKRDQEYGSSTVNRQQNEQSLRLCVEGLREGYGKAAYKNVSTNMLRYKRLRMFLHAQSETGTRDDQVRGFIRIGTDYTQNYYEYSLPLKITAPGSTSENQIWNPQNIVDVAFQDFIDAKVERNKNGGQAPYVKQLADGRTITVVGNPDFSAVQGVMIGIFNPTDNGNDQSVCIWADELRVFDFDRTSGWAATARFNTQLADLANITATGSFTSIGFGGLQDRVQQRSLDDVVRGDLNATVAVDKLLPEKLGLRIPVLVQAGHESRSPLYDPLDPDVKLEQSLQKFESNEERADYRKEVIDQTSSRSISVLNMRKERTNPEKKVRPYDIENFALSYSLTEQLHTDIQTDKDFTRIYNGALAYTYQTTPKNYTPLANLKALDSPYLKFFKEINFTPLPSRFAFRADLDRRYNERFLQRTLEPGQVPTPVAQGVFQKSFFFNRIYDLKWDLTKSLAFDYTATNRGVIDEGPGATLGNSPEAESNRALIRENIKRGGRTTNFNQVVALTYRLPLDKFPLTDWISADARYAATYTWQAASTALVDPLDSLRTLNLGNTVQNNSELSANGKIDLVKLYNKVRFLNIINNAPPPARPAKPDAKTPGRGGSPTAPVAPADTTAKKPELRFVKAVLRSLMTARSLNFTYTRSAGTLLPGYLPRTKFFGLDGEFSAPGVPFILGKQYELDDLYERASSRGWYTPQSQYLNTPLSNLETTDLNLRTSLEPIRDFNIQLDARRQTVRNNESFYRLAIDENTQLPTGGLAARLPLETGSFSASFISIGTLFGDLSKESTVSKAFNQFIENRKFVRDKLVAATDATNPKYSYNSQDVLIPAFLDAYRGRSSEGYKAKGFDPFSVLPVPNWTVNYNGLGELPFVQRFFRSVSLTHAYSSVYNVSSFNSSSLYPSKPEEFPTVVQDGLYVPYYTLGQVSIIERLSPLIGLNFQTLEKVTGRAEYRTDRQISLNISSGAQVTEVHTQEMVFGFGYVTNQLKLPFRIGGEQRILRNELTVRLDLSIRDNTTTQRTIVADSTNLLGNPRGLVVNGNRQVQLRPTIDYVLNQRLNLQFYFTRVISEPRGTAGYRNSATEGGVQLRYSLSQ